MKKSSLLVATILGVLVFPSLSYGAKDSVKPVISGAGNKTIYLSQPFNAMTGISAKDNVDGVVTKNIKVSGKVNIKKTGTYKLTYTVQDKAKNKTTISRKITVKKDTVKPVISGANNKIIYLGQGFNPLSGVTVKDNADGVITKNIKVSGSVNNKKVGTYKLTYTIQDKAKNKTTTSRTITVKKDSEKPILSGTKNKTIYIGETFNAKSGVIAKDNVDGVITKNIKVSGTVNTKKAGSYKLIYTIQDKAKNKTTVSRTITVKKDSEKPVISGIGNKTIIIGEAFNSLSGVTAKDNVDGVITKNIKVSGTVNTKKAGSYKLTYTAQDKAGNKSVINRVITISDKEKPVILGIRDETIKVGEIIDLLKGITATDNSDGDLTSKIKIEGSVNTRKAGIYQITYSVQDLSGNKESLSRKITILDDEKPIITGVKELTLNVGDIFNSLQGITATDNSDGEITSRIVVTGSVDTTKVGKYKLTYSVQDTSGNKATASNIVTVVDKEKPVISGIENISIGKFTAFDELSGVKAVDNHDGDLTNKIKVTGAVNTSVIGDYSLVYEVTDKSGNIARQERKVTVKVIPVANVVFSLDTKIKTGKIVTIPVSLSPIDATNQEVIWSSSNEVVATVDNNGVLRTLTEGTTQISVTVDGKSYSQELTVTNEPNVYFYAYASVTMNNVIKGVSVNLNNNDYETVTVESVEIYEDNRLSSSYNSQQLENSGINTSIYSGSRFNVNISFKYGIWKNRSEVVITVKNSQGQTYQYRESL